MIQKRTGELAGLNKLPCQGGTNKWNVVDPS